MSQRAAIVTGLFVVAVLMVLSGMVGVYIGTRSAMSSFNSITCRVLG